MDPTKLVGRVKEAVRIEHKARSNFSRVWNGIGSSSNNKFYHQDELENQLMEKLHTPEPDNKAQSHFISAEMQKNLLDICRCGRPRRGIHLSKCLQRALNTTLQSEEAGMQGVNKMPQTSNSYIGFKTAPYQKLEQSMQYLSPTISMPGPRITAAPYNAIIIG
ncbi:uncharacterized protein LOC111596271 isoform X2 [Drosophila hydei]|uniref:Uncharacterized protein LOC111596271 isoform X2 n=1 Tax=Drosophila hydei TaxID=7224 RepID=A0A6J2SS24_DROHY|nr:uncharacterized protein LOC111596271 isoform X2 [Drosophila hydei]